MFERYTEKARRAVFFARYEASQLGSPFIGAEHILLGVLRENLHLLETDASIDLESVRSMFASKMPDSRVATSTDLPLGGASRRILGYAAEEANRMKRHYIGCEHLLLGLLREKKSFAAKFLEQKGLRLDKVRTDFAQMPDHDVLGPRTSSESYSGRKSRSTKIIKLRNKIWNADHIREAVRRCCEAKFYWRKAPWQPRDAVVERKTGKLSLDSTLAEDSANFELVKGGWKKDLCAICRWELFEANDDHGTGYTNGRDWLCTECYEQFWGRPDFIAGSFGDMT
jgi:ATP-dependent Clp protease ATP-binding subunit ClpA